MGDMSQIQWTNATSRHVKMAARKAGVSPEDFNLDAYYRDKSWRPATVARYGTPEYFTFWNAFKRGADGQTPPGVEHDETIARYAKDGYNIGRLFRPLPCVIEARERDRPRRFPALPGPRN